jgi:hypothetical protein
MNAERRKAIAQISSDLENLRSRIDEIKEEEEEAYENLPDGLRDSEKGEAMQEAIFALEEASSSIDSVVNDLETAGVENA